MVLFDARFVFAGGHTRIFFENVIEMGDGIETQLVCNFRERTLAADQLFRFVDL